jgi:LmbE family N-acetylglucosaminyl deacetylase
LQAATDVLGVSRLYTLGHADSGMAGWPSNFYPDAFFAAPTQAAAERLREIIDAEQPQVLITYDETGGYGHPDHVKAHAVTLAAYELARFRPPKLYFVRIPLAWSRRFVAGLRAEGINAPPSAATGADAGPEVTAVGVADALVTTVIDVRAYLEVKRAAIACHRSQMPPDHFLMRMSHDLASTHWACEFFSRESGPTTASRGELETDLFAGLP